MKMFFIFLFWFTRCVAEPALPSKAFEAEVIKLLRSNEIRKIEISTAVFREDSYYQLQDVVSLKAGSMAEVKKMLGEAAWHDSKHVVTRREERSAMLLYINENEGIGLLSSDRIESGCFDYIEFSKINNKLFATQLMFRESVETNKEGSKSFQRVLIIPEWTKLSDAARNERLTQEDRNGP